MTMKKKTLWLCGICLCVSSCKPHQTAPELTYVGSENPVPQSVADTKPLPAFEPNTTEPVKDQGPLTLGIEEAILMAVQNNRSLIAERLNPSLYETYEQESLAPFDPLLTPEVSSGRSVSQRLTRAVQRSESSVYDTVDGSIELSKLYATGTDVALTGTSSFTDSSLYDDSFTSNRVGLSVTQALLRGRDIRANLARVNQARIDTLNSHYELRGFTEVLLQQVESKFWDYALAKRQIDIYSNSLALAEKQMAEIQERIILGDLAETELASAQAEMALQKENLISARSTLAKERLTLLRVLNPADVPDWTRDISLQYDMSLPELTLDDVEQHVAVALRMRPDLNQARLQIKRGNLEVVRTKNGLLPRLDTFINFGQTGYAETFNRAVNRMNEDTYDVSWGLAAEIAPVNRGARSQYARALITRRQLNEALDNLIQLIQVDVRSAYIEVTTMREQITATAATSKFQEEKLRAETEKFRVGKSTSLLVGQAQRDLVASQIAETQAIADFLKSLVSLYQLEGSLLNRRGIVAPGAEPVVWKSEGQK
ncbi:MAG: TolC family protein [Phycisphaerae bacterium]|nr:TolC family protein [Phycisphaerae bacterium]